MRSILDDIRFNDVSLYTVEGLKFVSSDPNRFQNRRVKNEPLANSNYSVTTSAFYSGRVVNLKFYIALSGRELLDASITKLRQLTNGVNKTLVMPIQNSSYIFYNVTLNNFALSNVSGGYAEINMEFISADPYYYSSIDTELLNVINLTSGNKSYPVTFEGTAELAPVIVYTLDSVTNGTNKTVTFSNPATSTSISITRTWTATNVLVVDCLNKTAKVNGSNVDFTGNLLTWESGSRHFNYTDDFTARQVDINVVYRKRYI